MAGKHSGSTSDAVTNMAGSFTTMPFTANEEFYDSSARQGQTMCESLTRGPAISPGAQRAKGSCLCFQGATPVILKTAP